MMKITSLLSLILILTCDDYLVAQDPRGFDLVAPLPDRALHQSESEFAPESGFVYPPAPSPNTINPEPNAVPPQSGPPRSNPPVELYRRVRYKDLDEKHPKAITTIVRVPDPATGWKRNAFAPLPMVHVAICVPPNCGPPKVKYKSFFREYEFDYGKYAVDVRLRDGGIEVDYQD